MSKKSSHSVLSHSDAQDGIRNLRISIDHWKQEKQNQTFGHKTIDEIILACENVINALAGDKITIQRPSD